MKAICVEEAWQFLKDLTNPESIVKLGLPLLLFVIFAETGLFVGFFYPATVWFLLAGCSVPQTPIY